MVTVVTNHGEYSGTSVDEVVRAEYGQKAFLRRRSDPESPHVGDIVEPAPQNPGVVRVLAVAYRIDTDE